MTKPETRRALFRTASASFIAAAVASAVPREAFAAVERDPRYADPKSLIVINTAFAIHPGHVHAIEVIDIPYEGYETGRMSWLKLHALPGDRHRVDDPCRDVGARQAHTC